MTFDGSCRWVLPIGAVVEHISNSRPSFVVQGINSQRRFNGSVIMRWTLSPWEVSLIVLPMWLIIVVAGEMLQARKAEKLESLVGQQFIYSLLLGSAFLMAIVTYTGWWKEVGLQSAWNLNNLKVLILPALALGAIWTIAFVRGLPSGTTLFVAGSNTLLIGVSEELMFRGIFFYGSQSSFGLRPTLVLSAMVFGLCHTANGLITGKLRQALEQVVFNTMFGLWIVALRTYLNTIIPLMLVHWLWDLGLFAAAPAKTSSPKFAPIRDLMPFGLEILLFGYGIWLLYG
jgi:uncharacterized protein